MNIISQIKEDKVFSLVYISGTAIAIASVMVIMMVLHFLVDNIGPEVHRDRTVYLNYNCYSEKLLDEILPSMECVEAFTTTCKTVTGTHNANEKKPLIVTERVVDEDFFKIYDIEFIEGDAEGFGDDPNNLIITDTEAMYLFGRTDSLVGTNSPLYSNSIIKGVVKQTSPLLQPSYATRYSNRKAFKVMATYYESYKRHLEEDPHIDFLQKDHHMGFDAVIMLKEGYDVSMFNEEWTAVIDRRMDMLSKLHGIPKEELYGEAEFYTRLKGKGQWSKAFNTNNSFREDTIAIVACIGLGIIMFILMLLPAINMSGLVSNRMEDRLPEMGIRKAFGAGRWRLLRQVLWENLWLTTIGGVVGFGIAMAFVNFMKSSVLMRRVMNMVDATTDFSFDSSLYFAPKLFVIAFLCCALLNVMVALIPAIRALKKPIVNSLNLRK